MKMKNTRLATDHYKILYKLFSEKGRLLCFSYHI